MSEFLQYQCIVKKTYSKNKDKNQNEDIVRCGTKCALRNSYNIKYIIKYIDSQSKEEEQIGNITNVSDLTSEIIGKQKIKRKISFGSITYL